MKLNHKQKIRLARKMMSQGERKAWRTIWGSHNWEQRRRAKAAKVFRQRNREVLINR